MHAVLCSWSSTPVDASHCSIHITSLHTHGPGAAVTAVECLSCLLLTSHSHSSSTCICHHTCHTSEHQHVQYTDTHKRTTHTDKRTTLFIHTALSLLARQSCGDSFSAANGSASVVMMNNKIQGYTHTATVICVVQTCCTVYVYEYI